MTALCPIVALVVDGEMGCEESCREVGTVQAKKTVTTQQRDRRTRISITNPHQHQPHLERSKHVYGFVVDGLSDEGRRGPARKQEPLLARLSRGTHRANASRIEILHKKKTARDTQRKRRASNPAA